ncbi:flagellar biosynthesis protein FliP [Photobacterium aphoticum]|uniref:Flagellar biosynthesis protein FliP n=1 Tax=Photobacterium aphoticum TaxID=754436 RepID=A0A090QWR6_9GAMM|nr:flagellar biosynthesis protein FliP [Photobacterium aphoticum]
MLSELKTAFQIGFMLFIPFLIIDIVVASVLMAMGMMMLSPLIISLPFKLMIFVMVDGWSMTVAPSAPALVNPVFTTTGFPLSPTTLMRETRYGF